MKADKDYIVRSDDELLRQNTPKQRLINIKGKCGQVINYQSLLHIEISKKFRKYQKMDSSVKEIQKRIVFAVCLLILAIILSLFAPLSPR